MNSISHSTRPLPGKPLLAAVILSLSGPVFANEQTVTTDLKPLWDESRLCANPDKGWYHHQYSNSMRNYPLQADSDLENFPGMDHLYVRLSWRHFEPAEGKFDWSPLDDLVEKWVPKGYGFSVRISCKESNEVHATPEWVVKAGAKGEIVKMWSGEAWSPDYGDPVFMQKLTAFHRAFAKRYDGKPWLRYVDVGSIGTWGEGHEFPAGKQPSVEVVKSHLDMHVDIYRKTRLVVADDIAHIQRDPEQEKAIRDHVEKLGISWRDDTPMVPYFVQTHPATFAVVKPDYFASTYLQRPVIFEPHHYPDVKKHQLWVGKNGSERGAEMMRGAIRLIRPTYIGYHGLAAEWLQDNPDLTVELANLCGYWYFPESLEAPETLDTGDNIIRITWKNRGLAPAYQQYPLQLRIEGPSHQTATQSGSDNRRWLPDASFTESYTITLPSSIKPGTYQLAVRMKDPRSGRFIDIGTRASSRGDDGFHTLGSVNVQPTSP